MTLKTLVGVAAISTLALAGCGAPTVKSVAPTPETIAFLKLEPTRVGDCVRVEDAVVDGVAGMITGNAEAAVGAQVRRGLERCGELAGLIRVESFPAAERPRALACRSAFTAKVDAYTALNTALAAEGDFVAAQSGARRFMSEMGEARPLMERCNTPAA